MKKPLTILFNGLMEDELKLMFGEKFKIDINSIDYSTQKKCYVIDINLICNNYNEDELTQFYPEGLNLVIDECWKFSGMKEPFILVTTIKID